MYKCSCFLFFCILAVNLDQPLVIQFLEDSMLAEVSKIFFVKHVVFGKESHKSQFVFHSSKVYSAKSTEAYYIYNNCIWNICSANFCTFITFFLYTTFHSPFLFIACNISRRLVLSSDTLLFSMTKKRSL